MVAIGTPVCSLVNSDNLAPPEDAYGRFEYLVPPLSAIFTMLSVWPFVGNNTRCRKLSLKVERASRFQTGKLFVGRYWFSG